jgi:D-alanyl-D-alanine carboxypeptidase
MAVIVCTITRTADASPLAQQVQGASTAPPHTPEIRAAAAYVMDRETGEAIFARFPSVRRSVASTTKLMTGLLAAESGRLDELFVVSQNAATVGETTMQAIAGERLTLRELTHGLMLPSGNDAAVAIAEALDGSVAGFANRMNRRAHELGMWDSQFANPHGLDHERFYRPDHLSTARDMAVLASAVGDNPEIRQIAGTTIFDIPSRDGRAARTLRNTLGALWWYPGLVAGKTGWTERAGMCRVVIADRGGVRLSVALLGTPDEVRELRDLLDYGFAVMEARRPVAGVRMAPRGPDDFGPPTADLSDAWERFWATFVSNDGMVRSSLGRNVGSSELQGDAMLHAVWMRDREAFDRLWGWTRTHLERTVPVSGNHPRDALYARRWDGGAVADWANDVGADQRIAGALMLASRTWREPAYAAAAADTLAAVLEKSAVSANRLGIAFEPTLSVAGQNYVVSSARSIVPAFMRSFAEGARQGVWHWLIDGSYATIRRMSGAEAPMRRESVPVGLWPSAFGITRQNLAVSDINSPFGRDAAMLVAQLAIEARWRSDSGANARGDRDQRAAVLSTNAARAVASLPEETTAAFSPGVRALLGCAGLVDKSIGVRADIFAQASASADASVVLDGLTGQWCQLGGPPDLWRVYLEPPARPTSRNDAVDPPRANAPWFHDDETGHVVSDRFAAFVEAHGGLDLIGAPLTDAFIDAGRTVQYFSRAILEETTGTTGITVTTSNIGRARALADGALSRPEAAAVVSVTDPPGRKRVGNSGHTIGGAFAKAIEGVTGLASMLGDPITEELEINGAVVQYFVGGRLEYIPGRPGLGGEPVRLTPVGTLTARDRGWLDASP